MRGGGRAMGGLRRRWVGSDRGRVGVRSHRMWNTTVRVGSPPSSLLKHRKVLDDEMNGSMLLQLLVIDGMAAVRKSGRQDLAYVDF